MATWKNININTSSIKAEYSNSVLIKMPNKSSYAGYCFYHPLKLVRDGRHKAAVSIGYTDDFIFQLKKFGKGRHNSYEVVDEEEIGVEEFEEAFGVMDENITAPIIDTESYLIVEEPDKVEIPNVEVPECLKNN